MRANMNICIVFSKAQNPDYLNQAKRTFGPTLLDTKDLSKTIWLKKRKI